MTEYQTITADTSVYRDGTIKLHGPEGFVGMRKAGRLAADMVAGRDPGPAGAVLPAVTPRRFALQAA